MSRPLRFLFVMHYPGYLRYFDSTVRLLAERGDVMSTGRQGRRVAGGAANVAEDLAAAAD